MKSLCIKTNYTQAMQYLLKSFENSALEDTYISIRNFKHYHNFIVHYKGEKNTTFYRFLSDTLTQLILKYYEKDIILNQINLNYFYFHSYEKKQIFENVLALLADSANEKKRKHSINNAVFKQLKKSRSFYLQAFISFGLNMYMQFLNTQIDMAVNKFLIDKEYVEFVNILKLYIKSEVTNSQVEHLHLLYQNKTSTLFDDEKNKIDCNENLKKAKYISDISFSSNDYALNTLLNLVPKKITVHLVEGYCDEFIHTLQLIFQEQLEICQECDICSLYRHKQIQP